MVAQHGALSEQRWSAFTLDQQVLMIANEMNRARKLMGPDDRTHLQNCYERVLRLVDLTAGALEGAPALARPHRPTLRRA